MCHNFPDHNVRICLTFRALYSTYFGLCQFCCKAGASLGHPKLPEIWGGGMSSEGLRLPTLPGSTEADRQAGRLTYMMLALCTAVTLFLPFLVAKSKANLAMRWDLARVTIFRHSMTPFAL